MEKLSLFLRRALWMLFLLLTLGGVLLGTIGNLDHLSYVTALACAFAITVFCMLLTIRGAERARYGNGLVADSSVQTSDNAGENIGFWRNLGEKKEMLMLALLCLVINGGFVLLFHPALAPDYQTFLEAAENLASDIQLRNHAYLAMFPHILGYSAFLSVFLRLFGGGIRTAAMVNAGLTSLSCLAIYRMGTLAGGRKAGRIAALLWILCPSKLLYNTMSLSEPYYTCLFLFFFLLVMRMDSKCRKPAEESVAELSSKKHRMNLLSFLCVGISGGVLLTLANSARPIGIIPIIAMLIWLFLLRCCPAGRNRETQNDRGEIKPITQKWQSNKHLVFMTAVMVLAYIASGSVWRNYEERILGEEPAGFPGYSVYVGFNIETGGSYCDEDMELLQSRYFGEDNESAEQAQRYMMERAKERIRENRKELPQLMLKKLGTLLGHDEAGAFYAKESLPPRVYSLLCILCNVWYYSLCLLAVPGALHFCREGESGAIHLLPLFAVGLVLAQLLVEVAARYHYVLIPILTLLAALSLSFPLGSEKPR